MNKKVNVYCADCVSHKWCPFRVGLDVARTAPDIKFEDVSCRYFNLPLEEWTDPDGRKCVDDKEFVKFLAWHKKQVGYKDEQ